MKILLTNTHIFLQDVPQDVEDEISDLLAFKVPGAQYSPAYKRKFWDGYKRFYNRRTKKCDAGFLEVVLGVADEYKEPVNIEDARALVRRRKAFDVNQWHQILQGAGIEPYNYISILQTLAAKKGMRCYIDDGIPWPRGIYEIATGGGKTSLAASIIYTINKKTLFLVNKLHLFYQTEQVFSSIFKAADLLTGREYKDQIGLIGDTIRKEKKVNLVMLHTAAQLLNDEDPWFLKFLEKIEVLVIDEAHHLNDNTYYQIAKRCKSAFYRYALTATPIRRKDPGDGQLVGAFGGPIVSISSHKLRERGALAEVHAWIVAFKGSKLPVSLSGKQAKRRGVYTNVERHELIVRLAQRFKRKRWPCLILVDQPLVHGQTLQEMFRELLGEEVPLINFQTPLADRETYLKELEEGRQPYIMASVGVFGEGINAPQIRALIRAEGGENEIRTLQAAGRGMRRKPHPNVLYLVDVWDQTHVNLERESRRRISLYEEEKYSVHIISDPKEIQFEENKIKNKISNNKYKNTKRSSYRK